MPARINACRIPALGWAVGDGCDAATRKDRQRRPDRRGPGGLDVALALGLPAGDGYPQGQLPGGWKRSMFSPCILFAGGALTR
jgi:hypothetical protein